MADAGPVRQTDSDAVAAYEAAVACLRGDGRVYACACTRATFAAWAAERGAPWRGPGCPGGCRALGLAEAAGLPLRVDVGGGDEAVEDLLLGPRGGPVAPAGDLVVRDRHGHWAYGFAVVVDDRRQAIDLVVRGEDLLEATPGQVRLARLLGRTPPAFLHHPLIRKAGGAKLSKSDGDTGVRELRAVGWSPGRVIAEATSRGAVPVRVVEAARPG